MYSSPGHTSANLLLTVILEAVSQVPAGQQLYEFSTGVEQPHVYLAAPAQKEITGIKQRFCIK